LLVRGPFLKKTKILKMTGFGVLPATSGLIEASPDLAEKIEWGVIRYGAR